MSIESDLAEIDAAILAQRIGVLAAATRGAQSEVEPYDYRRTGHVLAARGMRRVPAPCAGLDGSPAGPLPWWHHPWVARAQRVDLVAGLCVAAVGAMLHLAAMAVNSVAGRVGLSAPALIIAVAAGVVLVSMLCRSGGSGGGKRISGTFEGRVH